MPAPTEQSNLSQIESSPGIDLANAILNTPSRSSIIPLNDGELDLPPHYSIIDATIDALRSGRHRYDDLRGLLSLREMICEKILENDNVTANPEEILVTNGSSQGIFEFLQCYVSQKDIVLVPVPAWPSYVQGIRMAGGTPVGYTFLDGGLDLDYIYKFARRGARIIVINSPHNPTGAVLSREMILQLLDIAREFDMIVLSDEAYDGLIHKCVDRASVLSVSSATRSKVVTTRTFSKIHSMTGFRIGYIHAPRDVIDRCSSLHSHVTDNVCTFGQYGALAALKVADEFLIDRATVVEDRLNLAFSYISESLPCKKPLGGFYLFPDLSPILGNRWSSCAEFANDLMTKKGVATVAGVFYGYPNHLRISVAGVGMDRLSEAMGFINSHIFDQG